MDFKTRLFITLLALYFQTAFCQITEGNCPKEAIYFASTLPIDGANWYVPIKYEIINNLIDLKIKKQNGEELFIRFKIIKNLKCNFEDINNSDLKYRIITYDEETNLFEKKESEIEFKFSNGKGKIYIQHPNFPQIISDATAMEEAK